MPRFEHLIKQGIGASLKLKGLIIKSPGKEQPIEMQVNDPKLHDVKVLGECDPSEYSITKGKDSVMKLETLREIGHLRPRTNQISCVTRVRNNLAYATHLYFQNKGFQYIPTPIITGADCEGAGEMFQVTTLLPKPNQPPKIPLNKDGFIDYKQDFFGKETSLTVSGQLAVENYACSLWDVYLFDPTFRAEVSHTTRHLAEFWMIEPEI
ncbi:MAG: asparagine--tRNA ligase, partial [bacterium]|nr:asparagine--tRNA ligase [bacterium]